MVSPVAVTAGNVAAVVSCSEHVSSVRDHGSCATSWLRPWVCCVCSFLVSNTAHVLMLVAGQLTTEIPPGGECGLCAVS